MVDDVLPEQPLPPMRDILARRARVMTADSVALRPDGADWTSSDPASVFEYDIDNYSEASKAFWKNQLFFNTLGCVVLQGVLPRFDGKRPSCVSQKQQAVCRTESRR